MKVLKSEEMLCDHCVDRIKIGLMDAGIEAEVELSDKSIILPEDDDTLKKQKKFWGIWDILHRKCKIPG